MNQKLQKSLLFAVVLSETSHLFCCILPTIVSLMGLLAGLGMVVALPAGVLELHDFLHKWEIPMIAGSGVILALGWLAVCYSDKMDCHSTGCHHGACAPRKSRAHLVLRIATVLFVFNVLVYAVVHRSAWFNDHSPLGQHEAHGQGEHSHND
jgi:hypothetical protein